MDHRIRYPDPIIKVNDTVKIDLATGKITDFIKFDTGVIAMVIGGRNMGRVGVITHRERHDGGFNIVHIKDAIDNSFATRENNVFIIGKEKPWISLPKGKGVKVKSKFPAPFITIVNGSISFPSQKRETVVVPCKQLVTRKYDPARISMRYFSRRENQSIADSRLVGTIQGGLDRGIPVPLYSVTQLDRSHIEGIDTPLFNRRITLFPSKLFWLCQR